MIDYCLQDGLSLPLMASMESYIDLIRVQQNGNKLANFCVVATLLRTKPDRLICESQNDPPIQNCQAIEQFRDLVFC
jgi:hypothetical protein